MVDAPGAGAASVATQLLAFYREPARFRPHYIHGDEPLPDGHVVLKFALGRFAPGWHRDLPPHDQEQLIEAARAFVRQVCLWERATHYQVLCLARTAGRDDVKENYRLLMALLHPDRQAGEWPADAAQRVNEAHAVLLGERQRRAYDEATRKSHVHMPVDPAGIVHKAPRRRGILKPFLAVTAGAAALFVVQSWWMSDVPGHYSLLERAQWMKDLLPDPLPRLSDSKPIAFDPVEFRVPVAAPPAPAPRVATASVWAAPAMHSGEARAEAPVPITAPAPVVTSTPAPVPLVPMQRQLPREPLPISAREAPVRLAQVAAPAAVAAPTSIRPTTEEIETLVARVVSFYEAGDADGLVGLFDPAEMGLWRGYRTRGQYADFFRGTKDRRLRMDRLTWQTGAQSARARGDATLVARPADGTGRIERKLDVEIDIAMRDGQPRITRLVLFPEIR